ncbi:MAG: DUF1292 domain-containing protein [Oscillospiraceae bacterium]|nr:DUF1292 domain-containing protein [Oscillospiraceae bacterium]
MSELSEFTPDLYTLVDEDGVEQTFELIDAMETEEGQRYFALVPYIENPEDSLESSDDLVILKAQMDGDEELLVSIDDDAEFEQIGQMFMKRIEEMFEDDEDFEDSETE